MEVFTGIDSVYVFLQLCWEHTEYSMTVQLHLFSCFRWVTIGRL